MKLSPLSICLAACVCLLPLAAEAGSNTLQASSSTKSGKVSLIAPPDRLLLVMEIAAKEDALSDKEVRSLVEQISKQAKEEKDASVELLDAPYIPVVEPMDRGLRSRSDYWQFEVTLAKDIPSEQSVADCKAALRDFANSIPLGEKAQILKTHYIPKIKDPSPFRGELLQRVAANLDEIESAMGRPTKFIIKGLDGSIRAMPKSSDQVEVSLAYELTVEVNGKSPSAPLAATPESKPSVGMDTRYVRPDEGFQAPEYSIGDSLFKMDKSLPMPHLKPIPSPESHAGAQEPGTEKVTPSDFRLYLLGSR